MCVWKSSAPFSVLYFEIIEKLWFKAYFYVRGQCLANPAQSDGKDILTLTIELASNSYRQTFQIQSL